MALQVGLHGARLRKIGIQIRVCETLAKAKTEKHMGTDNVELLDKRAAEIIIHGSKADLIALVEARTRPIIGPPVWREYWDAARESMQEFSREVKVEDRFKAIATSAREIAAIKSELIRELCTSDWLYLDYWGCTAEVFGGVDPPGATKWEEFVAPMFPDGPPEPPVHYDEDGSVLWIETSGRYLLSSSDTNAMIASLRKHVQDLSVMCEADIAKLERWHHFCAAHPDFCVVYQIDY